jgi:hypothetical protein
LIFLIRIVLTQNDVRVSDNLILTRVWGSITTVAVVVNLARYATIGGPCRRFRNFWRIPDLFRYKTLIVLLRRLKLVRVEPRLFIPW